MSKTKFDPYKYVTNRIVKYFESSDKPNWKAPWQGMNLPRNADSSRYYNGINILILWIRMQEEEWDSSLFLTFNQIKKIAEKFPDEKCNVIKGSKSESICFWKPITRKDNETGEETTFPILRLYRVFNVNQVECSDKVRSILTRHSSVITFEDERDQIAEVEDFLNALGSAVTHKGTKAAYNYVKDTIVMPPMKKFRSTDSYYSTRFHEEAHRTGHETRLNRELKNKFGEEAYAFEELVAEISSAFLCSMFGFQQDGLQHPEYVKVWCKRMKGDKFTIFRASTLAKDCIEWMQKQHELS